MKELALLLLVAVLLILGNIREIAFAPNPAAIKIEAPAAPSPQPLFPGQPPS